MNNERFLCPVCEKRTLLTQGRYDICSECGWEDDDSQWLDPNLEGGANEMSLIQAREEYRKKLRDKSEQVF